MKIAHANPVNVDALTEALQAQWPGAVASYGAEDGGVVYVQNVDDTSENRAGIGTILAAHDPEAKTEAQQALEAKLARQESALAELAQADLEAMAVAAENANTVEALRAQVAALARVVGWLVDAQYPGSES